MKTRFALLFAALLFVNFVAEAQTYFSAMLTPEQEPSGDVVSDGLGTAAFVLDGDELEFYVSVDGLTGPITNAHFHRSAAGTNGGPVRTILNDFTGNTASGVWRASDGEPLTDELIAALYAGELYLNVHTATYGPGEIRGQIELSAGTALQANLTPEQEPSGDVVSDGRGTASVVLTDAGAVFQVSVEGLTGPVTNAHFHRAKSGTNGGPVRGIMGDFDGNTASGFWTSTDAEPLTDELIEALLLGELYVNIHTGAYGPGEIRGQVLLESGIGLHANLDADQESHDVESDGMGTASFTLTEAGVVFRVTVEGLTGPITNAHIHNAPAGSNGGPVRTVLDEFNGGTTAAGVWRPNDSEPLSPEMIDAMLAGDLYLNVHTGAYGQGEIRGQIGLSTGEAFRAELTPEQEPSGDVVSDGLGTAAFVLDGDELEFYVSVDGLTGPITNAHFHRSAAGTNGGPVRTILNDFTGNTASGVWRASDGEPLTDELIAALYAGELYLNVHTATYGPGEIRGQIELSAGTALQANLTPEQEPSGDVVSDGRGTASVVLTDAGAVFQVSVEGLTGPVTNAHFHRAKSGTNGGPVRGIMGDFDGNTASGFWTSTDAEPLTDELIEALLLGELYVNIHTGAYGPGEIRGQVFAVNTFGAAVALDPGQEPGDIVSDGRGVGNVMWNSVGVPFFLTVEGLTGAITNAHFHNAPAGMNGGPVRTIFDDFDGGNTASGVWRASDAEPLTTDMIRKLLSGDLYINVHTAANGPGEVRGQVNPNGAVITAIDPTDVETPVSFELMQNYPNPFNPETVIGFRMHRSGSARMTIFNLLGQEVMSPMNKFLGAGEYSITFNADSLPSGVYVYRLDVDGQMAQRMMIVLK